MRKLAVVREEQGAGRVRVEPPDRDDARLVPHEVDDGPPSMGVAGRRDHSGGLVQQDVRKLLRCEEPTVEVDDITFLDKRVQLAAHAVDPHATGLDQLVGTPARGDTGASEVGVKTHRRILALVTIPSPTRANFVDTIASGRRSAVPV